MSSTLRTLERNKVKQEIRKDGRSVRNGFKDAWSKFRDKKYIIKDEDGNIISNNTPRNTMPKKQQHFDNIEQYNRLFAYMNALKSESKDEPVESVEV